jgi:hypothetical protein
MQLGGYASKWRRREGLRRPRRQEVNRLLARITELLVVKPLINALAPAAGSGIHDARCSAAPSQRWHMMGERGPEMFMPKSAGVAIPNRSVGGGGTERQRRTWQTAI